MRLEDGGVFRVLYGETAPKLTSVQKKTNFVKRSGLEIGKARLKKILQNPLPDWLCRIERAVDAEAKKKHPDFRDRVFGWWYLQESNQGHKDFQSFALPTELRYQPIKPIVDLRGANKTGFKGFCKPFQKKISRRGLLFELDASPCATATPLHPLLFGGNRNTFWIRCVPDWVARHLSRPSSKDFQR